MRLAEIWRHPIKAHGRETIPAFDIAAGGTVPFDRVWGVAHEAADLGDGGWAPCANFLRAAKNTSLMAMTAQMRDDGQITLRHPERPELTFDPDGDSRSFLNWIAPLCDPKRAAPTGIVRAQTRGFTDSPFPSISLQGYDSLRALSEKVGQPLSPHRFRGNLWVEDLAPWEEFDLLGKTVTIGSARFLVEERITRCRATTADPETGRVDADTLGALEAGWGHRDFGVYMTCTDPGRVAVGDRLAVVA